MANCKVCELTSPLISSELGLCSNCLIENPEESIPIAMQAHRNSREIFGLPSEPPKVDWGLLCGICSNQCRIPKGSLGYCGLRMNDGSQLVGVNSMEGKLSWYHDPLPTNCVADWVCSAGTGAGYPTYAHCPGPEYGYDNLAIFFHGCSFNCLYCQNWHFRKAISRPEMSHVERLVSDVNKRTSCICFFGGDPTPQLPFALEFSKQALTEASGRILRICWETNGNMNPGLLDEMLELSLRSGGCIKFDLKAWNEDLHKALTGVSNLQTLENFSSAGGWVNLRFEPPLLVASTLLVPGYVEETEVSSIARFIAFIDPNTV